ncbi:MAG: response regulator [Ramlibacter sp.]|nr:response regulator [Ramlibacter sp.]
MNEQESNAAGSPRGWPQAMSPASDRAAQPDDRLLRPSIFGPNATATASAPAAAPAATVTAPAAPALKLFVKGLKPMERQLLEGLVKVSQRRTPRLELMDDARARAADVVVIDTRDAHAMHWARRHPWLARRAVIWIDGTEASPGHTLLRRPVQWPILPMVLARALESGPGTVAAAPPSAPGALTSQAPDASLPAHAPQVLVVDDSLAVRAQLRSLLERRGYTVTDADCVEVALDTLAQRSFDCVLMDVLMPDTDGYEGCHEIKARLRGAQAVPVIMLTSKSSPFDRIRGKMAGCDAYLTKPVDAQHLAEVLAQHVRAAPQRRVVPAPAAAPPEAPPPVFAATRPI